MEMCSPHLEGPKPIDWVPYESQFIEKDDRNDSLSLATLLKSQAFLLYLQCCFPLLQIHRRYNGGLITQPSSFETWLIDPEEHTSITLKTETIQSRGKALWEKLQQTVSRWEAYQQPSLDAFRVMVPPQDKMMLTFPC